MSVPTSHPRRALRFLARIGVACLIGFIAWAAFFGYEYLVVEGWEFHYAGPAMLEDAWGPALFVGILATVLAWAAWEVVALCRGDVGFSAAAATDPERRQDSPDPPRP